MENAEKKLKFNFKQLIIWSTALVIGCLLGLLGNQKLNEFFNFIAGIYSNLFKFVAVPTIALAITTTMAQLGGKKKFRQDFSAHNNLHSFDHAGGIAGGCGALSDSCTRQSGVEPDRNRCCCRSSQQRRRMAGHYGL